MIEILAPPLRIVLVTGFILLAKRGYFTWLTPESAHEIANQVMDFLVVAVPAVYALWAAYHEWRRKRAAARAAEPAVMIEAVARLPQVRAVEVKSPALADAIPSAKVVS